VALYTCYDKEELLSDDNLLESSFDSAEAGFETFDTVELERKCGRSFSGCSPGLMGVVVLASTRKTRVVVLQQRLYCLILCS